MKLSIIIISVLFSISSCSNNKEDSRSKWKDEIIKTEADFCKSIETDGLQQAFLKFSSEEVVLIRDNELIKGKKSLKDFYKNYDTVNQNIKLVWEPDFVDVSSSGDMAYTYGKYIFSKTDTSGILISDTGVFHTVWKRQENGKWLFVWD
ncbi:MAG: hypothetical protein C0595_13010 [Marinilabiliales bacterium]|nr:MAG: hypothetical protein C0595_13010 [Marinilabiliales bacterium]